MQFLLGEVLLLIQILSIITHLLVFYYFLLGLTNSNSRFVGLIAVEFGMSLSMILTSVIQ